MDDANPTTLSCELPEAAVGGVLPTAFRIFGPSFTARVGKQTRAFTFTQASAEKVMEAAKAWGNQHSSDWEHAALTAAKSGAPAPASAWYDLEVRKGGEGLELWAVNVKWTPTAAEQLSKREYRYFSPAFNHTEAGEVTEFVNLALTNLPATNHMKPLAASKGAAEGTPPVTTPEPAPTMKTVLAALSLATDASEAQALSVVNSLSQAQATLLSLTGKKTVEEALESVKASRAAVEQVATLSKTVSELEGKVKAGEVERLMAKGKAEKKITPAMEGFCQDLGARDIALLSKFIETATPVLPVKAQETAGEPPSALSAETLELSRKLGQDVKVVEANARKAGLLK